MAITKNNIPAFLHEIAACMKACMCGVFHYVCICMCSLYSICVCVCLSVCLSICLSVCLSVSVCVCGWVGVPLYSAKGVDDVVLKKYSLFV